jgi:hypothetical protein
VIGTSRHLPLLEPKSELPADPRRCLLSGRLTDACPAVARRHFEAWVAHLRFPLTHRRAMRIKLMYAALIRAAERWRGLKMTAFERRRLTALRAELDRDFATRTVTIAKATVTASYPANRGLDRRGPVRHVLSSSNRHVILF